MKNKGKVTLLNVGSPHMTSKDDSSVEEAKQMPTVTKEVFSTSDDPIVDVFNKVHKILLGSDGATRSIVETQAEEIKKLKRTVDGHETLLEILCSEYAKGRERPLAHQERYGSSKGIVVHDTKKQKKESHRKPKLACEDVDAVAVTNDVDAIIAKIGAGMNAVNINLDHAKNSDYKTGTRPVLQSSIVKQQPLKRRLEFVFGNDSSQYTIRAHGDKGVPLFYRVGAPGFIYGGDLPHCIDVVFRSPAGVNFVTVELAVATYVFGQRLSMKYVASFVNLL
ncbi:hypothetical protein HN873_031639 [Arachis hypogaea]